MTTYRAVLEVRESRHLYAGYVLSLLGDQLAGVALSVVVFDRTGSELLTAVAYASAWLPGIVGAPLLSPLADRWPRRRVLLGCDLVRAALVALLALDGVPLLAAILLMYAAHLFSSPFTAARAALMPDVLTGDAYVTGSGLTAVTNQVGQIAGFAVGGLTVAAIGAHHALLLDAGSFLLSALFIARGVRARPVLPQSPGSAGMVSGIRYVVADPWLRRCLLLVWLAAMGTFAPEAIAYPYALELGGGPTTAGLLLAAPCGGYAAGAFLLTGVLDPRLRDRLLLPAAVLSTAALIPVALGPPVPVLLGMLVLAGAGASFSARLNAIFVRRVAPGFRGRAMAIAVAGLLAAQGVGFLLAGAAVQAGLRPHLIVGLSGTAGTAAVLVAGATWWRTAAGEEPPAVHTRRCATGDLPFHVADRRPVPEE